MHWIEIHNDQLQNLSSSPDIRYLNVKMKSFLYLSITTWKRTVTAEVKLLAFFTSALDLGELKEVLELLAAWVSGLIWM